MAVRSALGSLKFLASWILAFLAFPHGVHAERVRVSNDLEMHYQTSGHGPVPIVFVPGWMMSSDVFVKQQTYFGSSQRFRYLSYDPRSQGSSSHTSTGNNYEQHGRDLGALLEKLGLGDVVLVGWSNGVFDVLSYVHQFGHAHLKALVLVDGVPRGSGKGNITEWVWFRYDDADHTRESTTMGLLRNRRRFNLEFADWMVELSSPSYRDWILDIANQTETETAALLNETCAYMDFSSDLEALDGVVPLTYIMSRDRGAVAERWSEAHTPSAKVRRLGKHLMFWEHSEEFNGILDEALKDVH